MTWFSVVNYTPSGSAAVAASAAPGSIPGFNDPNGNSWSINANNTIQQVSSNNNPWARNGLFNSSTAGSFIVDSQIKTTILWQGTDTLQLLARAKTIGVANTLGYMVTFNAAGTFTFNYVSGTSVYAPNGTVTGTFGTALVSGTTYVCQFSAVQTNSTTTTLTATMFASDGVTVINTATVTDTTSWLQNTNGYAGLAINGTGTISTFSNIQTFTDINNTSSTGYTITLPNSGQALSPLSGSLALVGGSTLTTTLAVTLSDGASGTFSPNPVTIPSGGTSVGFTYTPQVSGTPTVTWTYTGGNGGMTGNGSQSETIATAPALLYMNDASCVLSGNNWEQGSAGVTSVQSSWAGAYARFYVTGATGVNILVDGTQTLGSINWQIDNGSILNTVQIPSGGNISGIALPDTGPHIFTVYVSTFPAGDAGRWASTGYIGLKGIQLTGGGAAGNPSAVVTGTKRMLLYGDSISEGIRAFSNSPEVDGNQYEYSFYLGQALKSVGYEYSISACSGQGYTIAGTSSVPPLFTPGNDSNSAWDKVSSATSRLSSGQFKVMPTLILDMHGTNDGLQSVASGTVTTAVQGFYTAVRAAAPLATLIGVIPFGGYVRAAKIAGINAFIAASGDTNTFIIDLATDNRFSNTTFSGDGIHMQTTATGEIASLLIPAVFVAAGVTSSSGGSGSGSGGGSGSTPTVYPATYATTIAQGTNYSVDVSTSVQTGFGTVNVSKGTVITDYNVAKMLLASGVKLLPHP